MLSEPSLLKLYQIIAPSDAAFKNIPYTSLNGVWDPKNESITMALLRYHVIKGTLLSTALDAGPTYMRSTLLSATNYTNVTTGQNVLINRQADNIVTITTGLGNRCTLVQKDIVFQGGVVQVVDNLLIPPTTMTKTTQAFQISSFLASLYAAKLMPQAEVRNNVTIFAPNDIAIKAVGGSLRDMSQEYLSRIFAYHIVPDKVLSLEMLANNSALATIANDTLGKEKQTLMIRRAGNNKYVNSAQIVQGDILMANGILHIISNVLNPDVQNVPPNPAAGNQTEVYPAIPMDNPFVNALPCTKNCPVTTATGTSDVSNGPTTKTSSSTLSSRTSQAISPKHTAQVAGTAMGIIGIGVGMMLM